LIRLSSSTDVWRALALLLLAAMSGGAAQAAEVDPASKELVLLVAEPYLELREGPGRGYAITTVVPRGDQFELLYRRTEWFRVRTYRGIEGWATQDEMRKALLPDGSPFTFNLGNREGFTNHRWELGIAAGDYGGATQIGARLSLAFNEQLQLELGASQFLGKASNGYSAELGLVHVYRPDWWASPLLTLGTGSIWIKPRSTTVATPDSNDQTGYVGAGLRIYLARRFFLRGEYRHHLVFTSRDSNEEIKEWKLELAFFF
jgi:opacity protein-like surface antigen